MSVMLSFSVRVVRRPPLLIPLLFQVAERTSMYGKDLAPDQISKDLERLSQQCSRISLLASSHEQPRFSMSWSCRSPILQGVVDATPTSSLTHLNFSKLKLEEEGILQVCKLLALSPSLSTLDLSANGSLRGGSNPLSSHAFSTRCPLLTLTLLPPGCARLAAVLPDCSALTSLKLRSRFPFSSSCAPTA